MACLNAGYTRQGKAVGIARDHDPRQWCMLRPGLFDGCRHTRSCLAGTHYKCAPPCWWLRQFRGNDLKRVRSGNCRRKTLAK